MKTYRMGREGPSRSWGYSEHRLQVSGCILLTPSLPFSRIVRPCVYRGNTHTNIAEGKGFLKETCIHPLESFKET